jgi:hypothetical protein
VQVLLVNLGREPDPHPPRRPIAQLVVAPVARVVWQEAARWPRASAAPAASAAPTGGGAVIDRYTLSGDGPPLVGGGRPRSAGSTSELAPRRRARRARRGAALEAAPAGSASGARSDVAPHARDRGRGEARRDRLRVLGRGEGR